MLNPNLSLEETYWSKGNQDVVGIDEAGRGPWAGPLVASAVALQKGCEIFELITDSKKLSEKSREICYEHIVGSDFYRWGVGIVEAALIDQWGIQKSVNVAMSNAVKELEQKYNIIASVLLIDGASVPDVEGYHQYKTDKGDLLHYSIAAASIIAKVTRDRMMIDIAKSYPEYGFEKHKGYGTKAHFEALNKYGPSKIHRFSYKPIKTFLEQDRTWPKS